MIYKNNEVYEIVSKQSIIYVQTNLLNKAQVEKLKKNKTNK